MIGMSGQVGAKKEGKNHLKQSIRYILMTRLGTLVMHPEFGSQLPELLDAPLNDLTIARMYAATVKALFLWEPRIKITNINFERGESHGHVLLSLEGLYQPDNTQFRFNEIQLAA